MSKYGKLRFQNLPGQGEAIALYNLINGKNSRLNCSEDTDITSMICNALVNAVANGQQLNLQLKGKQRSLFTNKLSGLGLENLILPEMGDVDFGRLKVQLEHITSSDHSASDRSPGWKQLFRRLEQLSYGDFVATHGALGEKPLFAIIESLIQLKTENTSGLAIHQFAGAEFEFSANEYWHLRGRVHQGSQIYDVEFEGLHELPNLHPVFFDMYRPEEAKSAITETANRLLAQLHVINQAFDQWILDYKHAYLKQASLAHHQLRDEVFALQMDITDFLNRSKRIKSKSSWFNFGPEQNALDEEKVVLINAYENIRQRVNSIDQTFPGSDEKMTDLVSIGSWLEAFLRNSHSLRKTIKKDADCHLSKLNGHNIGLPNFQEQYILIQKRIRSLLNDVNGLQLFSQHIEDNTLEVRQQMDWLASLESRLNNLRSESEKIVSYLEWRQFTILMTTNDLKIINALKSSPTSEWSTLFELWYLQNFIETQDLTPINGNTQITQAMQLAELLMKDEWTNTLGIAMTETKLRLKKALKENKILKAWYNSSQIITKDIQKSIHTILQEIFPITMGRNTDSKSMALIISNDQDASLPNNCQIQISHTDEAATYSSIPFIKHQILHSSHSERIHGIKALSAYLLSLPGHFEIWQNSKEVILSFLDNHMNDFIFPLVGSHMQRDHISDVRQVDHVTETLINNHHRRFSICIGQSDKWTQDSWAQQLAKLRMTKISTKAGFDVSYISWSTIFENAELISFLKRESRSSRSAQSISA